MNVIKKVHITKKKVVRNLNKVQLSHIFTNLLENVINYRDKDLDIVLTETGKVIFTNTTSKLSEIQVGKIFDRYYTVESASKSTRLGLAITKNLIEQMNGSISAFYENNKLHICIQLCNSYY